MCASRDATGIGRRHHLHHNPANKRDALTIVHTDVTFRNDRTTPASRFFGRSHGDVFESLCEHMRARHPLGEGGGQTSPHANPMLRWVARMAHDVRAEPLAHGSAVV